MANNYLEFATTIRNPTIEEGKWWEMAAQELPLWEEPRDGPGFECDAIPVDHRDPSRGFAYIYISCKADGYGDPVFAGEVVQQFLCRFRPDQWVAITYCVRSDRYRPEEFGGGVVFVTANEIFLDDTSNVIARMAERHKDSLTSK